MNSAGSAGSAGSTGNQSSANTQVPCTPPVKVSLTGNTFSKKSVSLKMGEMLTIANTGSLQYTLMTKPDAGMHYAVVDPNETEHVKFPRAGIFKLSSHEHPAAILTVKVASTPGTTCGTTSIQTVNFASNSTNAGVKKYAFTTKTVTIKTGQGITLSNQSDRNLTLTSTPTAGLGTTQVDANEQQLLVFSKSGTYKISSAQLPGESFKIVVQK
jgi:plastocyanin